MSTTVRTRVVPDYQERMKKDAGTARLLLKVADTAKSRVRAPHDQVISTKSGIGPRGAFAQLIMRGPRAIFVEFGTRTQKPLAPLRNALASIRGVRVGR